MGFYNRKLSKKTLYAGPDGLPIAFVLEIVPRFPKTAVGSSIERLFCYLEDTMIKAIETQYKGHRFRSRLEARWALFFDAMGLHWEYELEGFDLGDSGYYLPDFFIPDWSAFLEIKPQKYWEFGGSDYIDALIKVVYMNEQGSPTWTIFGNPWPSEYTIYKPQVNPDEIMQGIVLADCRRCNGISYLITDNLGWGEIGTHSCGDHDREPLLDGKRIMKAYTHSRQFRFSKR
jgi:hypothetical protein